MKLYPKGTSQDQENLVFTLTLQSYKHSSRHLSWKISIIDQSGRKKFFDSAGITLDEKQYMVWKKVRLILRTDLFDSKKKLLKDNTLTLSIKFSFQDDGFSTNYCRRADKNELKKIYKQRKFTDVTLKFGDKLIKAHRTLLAACSAKFKKTLESVPKQSHIDYRNTGIEPEVAEKMIDFLYEENVENMEMYAKPLLKAADKLGMRHLKAYCKDYFYKKLNIENAAETLKLSVDYHSMELKVGCIGFIKK